MTDLLQTSRSSFLRMSASASTKGTFSKGISFQVSSGETKVLLGESGSGKTLIMKLAAGLDEADSGQILVTGQEVTKSSEKELLEFRRRIGFVFQESALFDSLTVEENVAFRHARRQRCRRGNR